MLSNSFSEKFLNFFVRSSSSAIKFFLLVYLASILPVEQLAIFNTALLVVGFAVTFTPLERHYFYVRKFHSTKTTFNHRLIFIHLTKLKINSLPLLLSIFALGILLIHINYLNISILILLLVTLQTGLEIVNVDYLRYLQLTGGKIFIATQVVRNITPPIIFMLLIYYLGNQGFTTELYLAISIIASFSAYYLCERYILGSRRTKISAISTFKIISFKHNDLKSLIRFPLLLLILQILPTYLDRFILLSSPDKSLFVNYSFYSAITTFFLILTQAFFIQPRLTRWFENRRAGIQFMSFDEVLQIMIKLIFLILACYFSMIVFDDFIPQVYRANDLHFWIFLGMLFTCTNGYLSAFSYAVGLDRESLRIDIAGFVSFLFFSLLILYIGDFRLVYGLPACYGFILLLLRVNIVLKRGVS